MARESLDLFTGILLRPLARAEDLLARLDERIARSACGQGFLERQHFADAAAALWLEGELVHMEDLVLHDGRMDVRAPTHEITRAHAVLRARRRIAGQTPEWALSPAGLGALRAREGTAAAPIPLPPPDAHVGFARATEDDAEPLTEELAEIDAVLARAGRALAAGREGLDEEKRRTKRDGDLAAVPWAWPLRASNDLADFPEAEAATPDILIRDPDRDEEALLGQWLTALGKLGTDEAPPVAAAFLAWDAWEALVPLERQHWLGNLLVAALLRKTGKARAHLPGLAIGLREVPRERRRSLNATTRCLAFLEGLSAAALAGCKEIDRLELAATQMERRLKGRRSNSHLPRLAELVLARPVVSAGLIAAELKVTQRAALNLIGALGVREVTGRGRYRAWGIV